MKIECLYAWICTEADGGEGVPAIEAPNMPGMMMPLIGADRARIEGLRTYAIQIAVERNLPIRLVQFSEMAVLETLPVVDKRADQ